MCKYVHTPVGAACPDLTEHGAGEIWLPTHRSHLVWYPSVFFLVAIRSWLWRTRGVGGQNDLSTRTHRSILWYNHYQHLTPRKQEKHFSRNTDVLDCLGEEHEADYIRPLDWKLNFTPLRKEWDSSCRTMRWGCSSRAFRSTHVFLHLMITISVSASSISTSTTTTSMTQVLVLALGSWDSIWRSPVRGSMWWPLSFSRSSCQWSTLSSLSWVSLETAWLSLCWAASAGKRKPGGFVVDL